MIPPEKSAAVARALEQTFGVSQFEDIRILTQGLSSALVFRITVQRRPYLLRLITKTDVMNDPTRQFACMTSAAHAGLAPKVHYTSIEDRLSLADFVEAIPFPLAQALTRIPETLRALHALPPFPRATVPDALDAFVRRFEQANLLPASETGPVLACMAELDAVYPRETEMVSCHHDLKPENILFDGQRVWLVDWEAAFLDDRYFDLAVAANFVVTNEAEERIYLEHYFGVPPSPSQLARFHLMQQRMHLFYAVVFLLLGSVGKPLDLSQPVSAFRDFHNRIWNGNLSLAGAEEKILYGRVHWHQLRHNLGQPRLGEALRIVSGYENRE